MNLALDTRSKINQIENQSTEFKLVWKDDYLKTICAFVNSVSEFRGTYKTGGYFVRLSSSTVSNN
jgi:predicted HTH transcriptional regulator